MEVELQVVDASYTIEGDLAVVELFGRTREGKSVAVRYEDFHPYFHVMKKEKSDLLPLIKRELEEEIIAVQPVSLIYNGEKRDWYKVTIKTPEEVRKIRKKFQSRTPFASSDIIYALRFYYDLDLGLCVKATGEEITRNDYYTDIVLKAHKVERVKEPFAVPLTYLSFDIECSIKENTLLTLGAVVKKGDEWTSRIFSGDEDYIIREFERFVKVMDPDIITGYNIDNYDLTQLVHRANVRHIALPHLSRNKHGIRQHDRFWRATGRVIADAWWHTKLMKHPKRETLNAVAQEILGKKKLEIAASNIDHHWEVEREKVMAYCLNDAQLALELLIAVKAVDKGFNIGAIAKLPLSFAMENKTTQLIDSMLIREADREGYAVPCTLSDDDDEGKIEGAYVHEMATGVRNWIVVLDVKSMYPNIMINHNLCFSTYDPKNGTIVSPIGAKFKDPSVKKGIVPRVVEQLLIDRARVKKRMKEQPDWYEFYDGLQYGVKVLANCFSEDTYALTPHGVKPVKDLKVGDSVYSINPTNLSLEIKPIRHTQVYDYDGPMYHFLNSSIDLQVTPDHNMLFRHRGSKKRNSAFFIKAKKVYQTHNWFSGVHHLHTNVPTTALETVSLWHLVDASFICVIKPNKRWASTFEREKAVKYSTNLRAYYAPSKYIGNDPRAFEIAHDCKIRIKDYNNGYCKPFEFKSRDFMELLGWFISEGSMYYEKGRRGTVRGRTWTIHISQKMINKPNRTRIRALIQRMGFRTRTDKNGISFSSKLIAGYILSKGLNGSYNKYIPPELFELHPNLLRIIYESLMLGDGDSTEGRYSTVSRRLAEDMVHLCLLLGYGASYIFEKAGPHRSDIYRVYIRKKKHGGGLQARGNRYIVPPCKRQVYCVTVKDNHTIYAGRNGKFAWCGQSIYGAFTSGFYRFTNKEIGASITAYGREMTTAIIDTLSKEHLEVVLADTDSVGVQSPYKTLDETIKFGKELSERFSKGGFTLEFEKVFQSFFSHGAKKRYVGKVVWPEETLFVRGYEMRRTDAFDLQSTVLEQVFILVLDNRPTEAIDYARGVISDLKKGRIDINKLVISKTCKPFDHYKKPDSMANVRTARKLMALQYPFTPGSKVSWIVTDSCVSPAEVEPYIDGVPFTEKPDLMYYAERLAKTVGRVGEAFGWPADLLMEGKEQQALYAGTEKRATAMKHPTVQPQARTKQKSLEVFGDD